MATAMQDGKFTARHRKSNLFSNKGPNQMSIPDNPVYSASHCIQKATDLLLLREFDECISECQRGIVISRQLEDATSRSSLAVILIQAYAEQERWREVLPVITAEYQGIEGCPSQVIQILVLLHARVEEFAQCHAIASIWLKTNSNHTDKSGYKNIVEVYLLHVLIRQNKWQDVSIFLKSCIALKHEDHEHFIKVTEELQLLSEKEKVAQEVELKKKQVKIIAKLPKPDGDTSTFFAATHIRRLLGFMYEIGTLVTRRLPNVSSTAVFKIITVSICVYMIAIRSNYGDLLIGSDRVYLIADALKKVLLSIFWPTAR